VTGRKEESRWKSAGDAAPWMMVFVSLYENTKESIANCRPYLIIIILGDYFAPCFVIIHGNHLATPGMVITLTIWGHSLI